MILARRQGGYGASVRPIPAVATVPALLDALLRDDGARPVVTWVDTGSGARVELSVATVANWVAKTGGLLQDGLDVEAGDRVRLDLGCHWLGAVWPLACWGVGAVVVLADAVPDQAPDRPSVEVVGDGRQPRTLGRPVVVGLGAFGGPAQRPVPPGALDAGREVLGHPDVLVPYETPEPDSPALLTAHGTVDQAGVLARGRERGQRLDLPGRGRLLTSAAPTSRRGLDDLLAALVTGGAVVLAAGADTLGAADLGDLVRRERIDVTRTRAA